MVIAIFRRIRTINALHHEPRLSTLDSSVNQGHFELSACVNEQSRDLNINFRYMFETLSQSRRCLVGYIITVDIPN